MTKYNFANEDQRMALTEIHDMCFFETDKQSDSFWEKVALAGEFESNEVISQDSFELAMYEAKQILFNQGVNIFTRKKRSIRSVIVAS